MFFNNKNFVYVSLYLILGFIIASIILIHDPKEMDNFSLLRWIIVFFASVLLTKYFIYMTLSPWEEVRSLARQKKFKADNYHPLVSVIIPSWNEQDGILTTVKSLLNSEYTNMEILVVDNASTDNTAEKIMHSIRVHKMLKKIEGILPYRGKRFRYYYESTQGKGHALNLGLEKARGEIIISIDADCYIPPETIGNFVKQFADPKVMAAVGNVRIGNTDKIVNIVQYLEFLFSFYFKKAESLANTIYIIGGAAGAFRREVFQKIGTYSVTNITEDIELSVRIQAHGMRIAYASDALVYTEGADTLKGLLKQRLRWKRGRIETFIEHKNLFFSRDRKHNPLLTWIILPLAIVGDTQLALEILFLLFLYFYSFFTGDFTSFISGIIVVTIMFLVQIIFDKHRNNLTGFIFLAPIGWLLFYLSTFVETYALYKASVGYLKKQEATWQKWERKGVFVNNNNQLS